MTRVEYASMIADIVTEEIKNFTEAAPEGFPVDLVAQICADTTTRILLRLDWLKFE